MKLKRLLLIVVALGAGLMAAMLVGKLRQPPPAQVVVQQQPAQKAAPATEVLVLANDVPVGHALQADDLEWQAWPEGGKIERFLTRTENPEGLKSMTDRIVRQQMFAGEPVQEVKLVSAERGFMSAILPSGMRAVAVEVRAASTAGGFILPNDRVDILLTRASGDNNFITETLLENIRVLAIDQVAQDPKDAPVVVARDTATLELTPAQAEMITQSQQIGAISLALRSIEDANPDLVKADGKRRSGGVNIVRFGVPTKEVTRQ